MALRGQGLQRIEVRRARDHDVLAGYSVRQHIRLAAFQHIRAVLVRDPRSRAAALLRDGVEHLRHSRPRRRAARLEIFLELAARSIRRSLRRLRREARTVLQRSPLRVAT